MTGRSSRERQLVEPTTLVFITTYACSAACQDCCFACSPERRERLSLESIRGYLSQAVACFPNLVNTVFSGGECFLHYPDLLEAIRFSSQLGLLSRCVSNAYWGKSARRAARYARELRQAGLSEINFSTGAHHERWVPLEAVANATRACIEQGITVAVVVEGAGERQQVLVDRLSHDPAVREALGRNQTARLRVFQSCHWIGDPSDGDAGEPAAKAARLTHLPPRGCDQLFGTVAITPEHALAVCCGLTIGEIPEMLVGDLRKRTLSEACTEQQSDLLKRWLWLDGPAAVLAWATQAPPASVDAARHPCEVCRELYRSPEARQGLRQRFAEIAAAVLFRSEAKAALVGRVNASLHDRACVSARAPTQPARVTPA